MTGELSKNCHGVGIGPLSKILAVKRISKYVCFFILIFGSKSKSTKIAALQFITIQRMRVISTTILETNKNVLVPLQTGESELIPRAKENNPMYFDLQRVIEKHKREHA